MNILDNEWLQRLEKLESTSIKCKCACEGRGGEHECGCIPNVKHRCIRPRFQETEKKECEREDAKLLMETHLHVFHSAPAELKPAPSECGHKPVKGALCRCYSSQPSGEVEEKIAELCKKLSMCSSNPSVWESYLLELMAMVRKGR